MTNHGAWVRPSTKTPATLNRLWVSCHPRQYHRQLSCLHPRRLSSPPNQIAWCLSTHTVSPAGALYSSSTPSFILSYRRSMSYGATTSARTFSPGWSVLSLPKSLLLRRPSAPSIPSAFKATRQPLILQHPDYFAPLRAYRDELTPAPLRMGTMGRGEVWIHRITCQPFVLTLMMANRPPGTTDLIP